MISIIIPCFNEHLFLPKVLKKISSQNNIKKEIILVDDGSNEETKKVINECLKENLIDELITLDQNYGKGFALKKGIEKSKGEIVLFQDADLEYDPDDTKTNSILDNKADIIWWDLQVTMRSKRSFIWPFFNKYFNKY